MIKFRLFDKQLHFLESFFDRLAHFWEGRQGSYLFSNLLVISFVGGLVTGGLNHYHILPADGPLAHVDFFSAIDFSFVILLLIEMVGLVFVIPQSIANSIGKQFEILCLILLRSAFEEFTSFDLSRSVDFAQESVLKMLADGFCSLVVFLLIGIYYKMQKHRAITTRFEEQEWFIIVKKMIALCILVLMVVFEAEDMVCYFRTGAFQQSFTNFYMILIYGDLLFMLIAFRFVIYFPDIFRYSSFVLITILIRLSLAAPVYFNGLLAIITAGFAIGVVYFHNTYIEGMRRKNEEQQLPG